MTNKFSVHVSPEAEFIAVDETPINTGYRIDYTALAKSSMGSGDYFILTCDCGDAGCAGLFDPIKVRVEPDYIFWNITQPTPRRNFTFDRSRYLAEIARSLKTVIELNLTLPDNEKLGPFGTTQEGLERLLKSLTTSGR